MVRVVSGQRPGRADRRTPVDRSVARQSGRAGLVGVPVRRGVGAAGGRPADRRRRPRPGLDGAVRRRPVLVRRGGMCHRPGRLDSLSGVELAALGAGPDRPAGGERLRRGAVRADGPDGVDRRPRRTPAVLRRRAATRSSTFRSIRPRTGLRCWSSTPGCTTPWPTASTPKRRASCEAAAAELGIGSPPRDRRSSGLDAALAAAVRRPAPSPGPAHRHRERQGGRASSRCSAAATSPRSARAQRFACVDARRLRDLLRRAGCRGGRRDVRRSARRPDDRRRVRWLGHRTGSGRTQPTWPTLSSTLSLPGFTARWSGPLCRRRGPPGRLTARIPASVRRPG